MNRRGQVKVRQQDIFSHFEHVVVGFYKPNYVPLSYPVTSKSREELVFEINVLNKEDVSIRFNQLYFGYFDINDRPHYQYSSLLMELYEVKESNGVRSSIKIVDYCQGCSRSLAGTRSSRINCLIQNVQQVSFKVYKASTFFDLKQAGTTKVFSTREIQQSMPLKTMSK